MEPKDIVTSLDWSKKLNDAGWPKDDTLHFWILARWKKEELTPQQIQTRQFPNEGYKLYLRSEMDFTKRWSYYVAPTASEILGKLPKQTADDNFLTISPEKDGWAVYYETSQNYPRHTCRADTLADAAASMYVYLAENKLLP